MLSNYLHGVEHVTVGGETGRDARLCDYDWVLDIRRQCKEAGKHSGLKRLGLCLEKMAKSKESIPTSSMPLQKNLA